MSQGMAHGEHIFLSTVTVDFETLLLNFHFRGLGCKTIERIWLWDYELERKLM